LEGMVESHDDLITEISREIGLDRMGEDAEAKDDDDNDGGDTTVDVLYAAPQAHGIVNVALHREYSLCIIFIFSQGRKDLYHV
jgi:hypothetical protein